MMSFHDNICKFVSSISTLIPCVRAVPVCAKKGYFVLFSSDGKIAALAIVFLKTGLLKLSLHPKALMMSKLKLCFTLKNSKLLFLLCMFFRVVSGEVSYQWILSPYCAETPAQDQ